MSGGGKGRVGGGGQGGCERRIEVFVKIPKKQIGGGGWVGLGGQVGCDRRIEVFGKIHKKNIFFWGGGLSGWWGVRVDVNEELKFFVKIQKKTIMMFIKHYAPNRCLCIKVAKSTMCN